MGWALISGFVAPAVAVAALAAVLAGALAPAGLRRRVIPFALCTAFFLALTQLPLADPASVACPVESAHPQLAAFRFVGRLAARIEDGTLAWALTHDIGAASAAMNLLLCILIGWTGAPLVRRPLTMAALGAAGSLLVELTQLTGLWGYYPCAIREFSVDDLILNIAGVAIGAFTRKGRLT